MSLILLLDQTSRLIPNDEFRRIWPVSLTTIKELTLKGLTGVLGCLTAVLSCLTAVLSCLTGVPSCLTGGLSGLTGGPGWLTGVACGLTRVLASPRDHGLRVSG